MQVLNKWELTERGNSSGAYRSRIGTCTSENKCEHNGGGKKTAMEVKKSMTDLFNNSPNDQTKADEQIKAGHFDIVNSSNLREKKNLSLSIVGSSKQNGIREVNDFYPTPSYAVEELLKRETFSGNIWEPACGDGAISEVLKKHGYNVISTDLIYRNYGVGGIDFLTAGHDIYDNIITNPPFKHALEFVLKSKKASRKKIAMFLKTVFLESSSRYDMFQDKEFPLKAVYQFSKRVTLFEGGVKRKCSGLVAYAWFVWDSAHTGEPMLRWIK